VDKQGKIRWRVHFSSSPAEVFRHLSTDVGRALFWAESAKEEDGYIIFHFPNGMSWRGRILENDQPHRFQLIYYGGSTTTFDLADDGTGGTDLLLTDGGVSVEDQNAVFAGLVSVLLALKAQVDFGVDLRNHDPVRTWDQWYADN
jgi:uncharacterized protein YndB with AHSA1/START domain